MIKSQKKLIDTDTYYLLYLSNLHLKLVLHILLFVVHTQLVQRAGDFNIVLDDVSIVSAETLAFPSI